MSLVNRVRALGRSLYDRPEGRLPVTTYAGYGIGQIGGQIMRDTPALLLPFFMTSVLGLDAFLMSYVILIPKIWVFFADPLTGIVSDRTNTPWGRRRPFLLVGGIIGAVSFYFMFNVPTLSSQIWLAAYMTLLFALMSTGFSLFSVPYLSMASEMSEDPEERTSILSWRNVGLSIGLLVGGSLAPRLTGMSWAGYDSYEFMGLVLSLLILLSTLGLFFGTAKAPRRVSTQATVPLGQQIRVALSNKPFVILISANIVQYLAAGVSYAGTVYLLVYVAQKPLAVILPPIILIMVVTSIGSMPLWVKLAGRFGKMPVYVWSLVLFSFTMPVWLLVGPDRLWPVWLGSVCIGVFNTGFILMSYSVLTDTIDYDRLRSGLSREGILSAVYSATEKISFASGSALLGLILGFSGFISSTGEATISQPDSALWGIRIGFAIVPSTLMLSSLLILRHYNLSTEQLKNASSEAAQ